MNFSNNLQYLRKNKNLSQEQLAEKLNVTRQSVSKWESGQSYPEMDKLIALCKLFGCSLEQLVNGNVSESEDKDKPVNIIENVFKKISHIIDDIVQMLESKDLKGIIKFIVEIIIIIALIWILKLPFLFLENIIRGIFQNLGQFGTYINIMVYYLIEIAYIVASLLFFAYAFKTRFLCHTSSKTKTMPQEATEEEKNDKLDLEEKKEYIKRNTLPKKHTLLSIVVALILFCIKIFTFFILCFVIIFVVLFASCFATSLILLLQGVSIFGIVLGCLGILIITIVITEILVAFIFNHKSSFKRLFITFCISLLMIGGAFAVSLVDVTRFKIINGFPEEYPIITSKTEIQVNKNTRLGPNIVYEDIEYVTDNNLKDKIMIETSFHKNFQLGEIMLINDEIVASWTTKEAKINELYISIINGLKDGKIYNFNDIYKIKIKIYGNNRIIEQLKTYQSNYEQQQYELECENRIKSLEEENLLDKQSLLEELEDANEEIDNKTIEYEELYMKYNELLDKIKNLSE